MLQTKISALLCQAVIMLIALFSWASPALAEPYATGVIKSATLENEVVAANYQKQNNLLVLMYHDFSREPPVDRAAKELVTTGEKFAADIDALIALGYLPISLEDYYYGHTLPGQTLPGQTLPGQTLPGHTPPDQKYFAITFDDGYQGVYDIAYQVLLEKQVPAAVFFNTGMEHHASFLHYQQLQELEQSGLVKIYTHLAYHQKATQLPEEIFVRYLDASVRFLNKYMDEKPMFLAYPYGDYNRRVHDIALEQGIRLQFVQKALFAADDVLVRTNVAYDAVISDLVRKAVHN